MTIDDLLARWGFWRSVRDDNGLGYATSAANRAMAGDANTGGTRPLLPYGVDADSVFSAVDRVVMKELPAASKRRWQRSAAAASACSTNI